MLRVQPNGARSWVFRFRRDGSPRRVTIGKSVRAKAGLDDVHNYDIRPHFASGALVLGEGLPIIGRLLGYRRIETTARYAHLARDSVRESAGRISVSIADDIL